MRAGETGAASPLLLAARVPYGRVRNRHLMLACALSSAALGGVPGRKAAGRTKARQRMQRSPVTSRTVPTPIHTRRSSRTSQALLDYICEQPKSTDGRAKRSACGRWHHRCKRSTVIAAVLTCWRDARAPAEYRTASDTSTHATTTALSVSRARARRRRSLHRCAVDTDFSLHRDSFDAARPG